MLPSFSNPPLKRAVWPASKITVNEAWGLAEGALTGSEVGTIERCLQKEVATEPGFEGCVEFVRQTGEVC